MAMRAGDKRRLGTTNLSVTALSMGCASLGGLYTPVSAADALATLQAAWDSCIRYFDVAPMYGLTRAEHLLGQFLREEPQCHEAVVSTKVGRLFSNDRPGHRLPPEPPKNPLDPGWQNGLPFRETFDYSYDGIMRSFDDSQQRMGTNRLDILFIHDIGVLTHGERNAALWRQLTSGGFRALSELREAGLIAGFGLGVNEAEAIAAAMDEVHLDCCLLAGRHSLLEQDAVPLLDRAHRQGTAIVIGGVFNSGILATGTASNAKFNYKDAPAEIVRRTEELARVCAAFDVPLGAAAVQFPLFHPAVASVLVGAKHPDKLLQSVGWFEAGIPEELWQALQEKDLLAPMPVLMET
ncbi:MULTISPECIES: aldo/keto reductase [Agrobacterium]|uniref:aldo/keto reductase n=1 Tax=Agrobacterium TaxID=357 RepID=UPI001571670E|nr:aldo/keto reductase [Agrobacterium tumefaciens]WCJ66029.1 aldo/keto reductase [Agrobacterium tumefaciens]